jgi:hypothetical protein
MSEKLSDLVSAIDGIIQDDAYDNPAIIKRINEAVNAIASGIRMPDGSLSPPLPDLIDNDTVTTGTNAYVSLPADYQRNVFLIADSSGNKILPPRGGDYCAYRLFLKQIADLRLTESGSVYAVAVKGNNLYYQGIPTAAETIYLHFYRKPTEMALDGDTPDGIPDHLQMRLIKHYVCKEIYGEALEDGQDNIGVGYKFHSGKFMEAMMELVEFVGIDAEPQYYGPGGGYDAGACDG